MKEPERIIETSWDSLEHATLEAGRAQHAPKEAKQHAVDLLSALFPENSVAEEGEVDVPVSRSCDGAATPWDSPTATA